MSAHTSEEDSSDKTRPKKVSKTQAGQDVARWAKPRRAARACDRCRASKLRCMPSTTVDGAFKCAYCEKMDHDCVYTDLAPHVNVRSGEANDRLSQLETNVSKLLEIMTGQHVAQSAEEIKAAGDPPTFSDIASLYPSNLSPNMPPRDLLSLAVAAQTASHDDLDFQERPTMPWLSRDIGAADLSSSSMQRNVIALPSIPIDPPSTSSDEKYSSPQARPIPKSATASRMAAFSDPHSHEAPFRCLAYNPDLFRNVEMSDGNGSRDVIGDGGKTPKRGKGDPIDRGIFSEAQARALFDFYCHEISFFLPICQEPTSFDHIRHRSSFLLSTILAIASKYSTKSRMASSTFPFTSSVQEGYGVKPVEEDQWQQIRALSTLCYFQAMISKVHCLEDVQAALLLCAWGLQERGASPDPWMVAGSAYRLARRLGLHQIASNVISGTVVVTSRLLASWKTYLCLYALDRLFTVGFGRPETEGYQASTVDTRQLISLMEKGEQYCSVESSAYTAAIVELANIARQYSHLVNITLKVDLQSGAAEKCYIGSCLDEYARRWLWSRSALAGKLGRSKRVVKLLYDHIRLCIHAVPTPPGAEIDIGDAAKRSKKAEDTAISIIQSFTEDLRDDSDTTFCFAIDYVYMVLSHSAAFLLSSSATRNYLERGSPQSFTASSLKPGDGIDRNSAMRYCGMAINGLVGSDSSAIYFPSDMACNLCLIAKEVGMNVDDWVEAGVAQILKQRADPDLVVEGVDANWFGEFIDWGMLSDLDFIPP